MKTRRMERRRQIIKGKKIIQVESPAKVQQKRRKVKMQVAFPTYQPVRAYEVCSSFIALIQIIPVRPIRYTIGMGTRAQPIVLDEIAGSDRTDVLVSQRAMEAYESRLKDTKEHQSVRVKLEDSIPLYAQTQIKTALEAAGNKFVVRHGFQISVRALKQLTGIVTSKVMTDSCFCAYIAHLQSLGDEEIRLLQPSVGVQILNRSNPIPIRELSTGGKILIPCKSVDHWYVVEVRAAEHQITVFDPYCKARQDDYVKETAAIIWWAGGSSGGQEDEPWSYTVTHPMSSTVSADVNIYVCVLIKRMMRKRNAEVCKPLVKDARLCIAWELMTNRIVSSS